MCSPGCPRRHWARCSRQPRSDLIDVRSLAALWRLSRIEFLVAIGTILGVVVFGVLKGVILAVAATLAHLLWLASQPRDALLGTIPGRDGLYKLHMHPDARAIPGLTLYLVQVGVVFFNAEYVKKRILAIRDAQQEPTPWFLLDASATNHLDSTAVEALEDVRAELAQRGITFSIAGMHSIPREMVERSGLADRIGRSMLFESAEAAVVAFQARPLRHDDSPTGRRPDPVAGQR
jgi:sulfate permease, SulP family